MTLLQYILSDIIDVLSFAESIQAKGQSLCNERYIVHVSIICTCTICFMFRSNNNMVKISRVTVNIELTFINLLLAKLIYNMMDLKIIKVKYPDHS